MACRPPQPPTPRDIPYKYRGLVLQKNRLSKASKTKPTGRQFNSQRFFVSIYDKKVEQKIGATAVWLIQPTQPRPKSNRYFPYLYSYQKYHTPRIHLLLQRRKSDKQSLQRHNLKPTSSQAKLNQHNAHTH